MIGSFSILVKLSSISEGHMFEQKLKCIKANMKIWNNATFGDIKERKETIKMDIAMVDSHEWGFN